MSIAGAGEYRGGKLVSDNTTVTVSGAGRVVVYAERTLKATISGAGSVEYLGDPQVTEQISGAGRVRKRDTSTLAVPRVALAVAAPPGQCTAACGDDSPPLNNSVSPVCGSRSG